MLCSIVHTAQQLDYFLFSMPSITPNLLPEPLGIPPKTRRRGAARFGVPRSIAYARRNCSHVAHSTCVSSLCTKVVEKYIKGRLRLPAVHETGEEASHDPPPLLMILHTVHARIRKRRPKLSRSISSAINIFLFRSTNN